MVGPLSNALNWLFELSYPTSKNLGEVTDRADAEDTIESRRVKGTIVVAMAGSGRFACCPNDAMHHPSMYVQTAFTFDM